MTDSEYRILCTVLGCSAIPFGQDLNSLIRKLADSGLGQIAGAVQAIVEGHWIVLLSPSDQNNCIIN